MKFKLKFEEENREFNLKYGEVIQVSDGGFESGYEQGFETGSNDGYSKGYNEGLKQRTYEIWTITLKDGSVIEKEVALL